MKPKEGTILTVARVIAEETEKVSEKYDDVKELFKVVLNAGDAILKRTPDMLPVLKQADAVGGVLIGFVQGVLFICVLALLLSVFSSTQSMRGIVSAVEDSHIAKYIYENNFIGQIISRLF